MINKIKISALKSIKELEISCKNLNIITGTNSAGKSTVLQAIILFFQSHTEMSILANHNGGMNGSLISLGEFRENKNVSSSDKKISIEITFNDYENCTGGLYFYEDDDLKCCVGNDRTIHFGRVAEQFLNDECYLRYLSCNRVGANDIYNKDYRNRGIGQNGEYAIFYLEENKSNVVDTNLIKNSESYTLLSQVNHWLNYIVNATISTESIQGTDTVKASYKVGSGRNTRPKNVGSGVSYLISILVLCLSAQEKDIIIIENPEIHLHPKAQSKVCEFLYFIAKSGRQIFVETHSDHIFNGVRAGIATKKMEKDTIAMNFFQLNDKACTENIVVEFGEKGRILNYTQDMFDQFDADLDRMLGI